MTLQDRITETQVKFDELNAKRDKVLATIKENEVAAAELLVELNKLQGEYRLLSEMLLEEQPTDEATTITATPDKKEKK